MAGMPTIVHPWDSEYIVACRWVEFPEMEIGSIPGVAYRNNDKIVTELLRSVDYNVSVKLYGGIDAEMSWAVHHVFVERYIKYVLRKSFQDVEIYRIHVAHGDFEGERPSDISGEVVSHFQEIEGKESWFSYEHLCGPYLADMQPVVSAFTAGRLTEVSARVPQNLIPNRRTYVQQPQDLPLLGVIVNADEITMRQKIYEDLLIRCKKPKIPTIN